MSLWDAFLIGSAVAFGALLPQILFLLGRELLDLLRWWPYRNVGIYKPVFLPTISDRERPQCSA